MRRLMGYMRPYRALVFFSLLFLLAESVLQVLNPLLTRLAVDKYIRPGVHPLSTPIDAWLPADPWAGRPRLAFNKSIRPGVPPLPPPIDAWLPADPWAGLTRVALLYLAVLAGGFITGFAQTVLMQWTGQLAMFDLRKQLMEHLQGLDLAFYDRNPVGRLVTRVTTDVDVLNDLFASGLVTILGDLMVLGFIIAIMYRMSPLLTGILMAAMPIVIVATLIFRRTVTQSYRRIRVAIAKINADRKSTRLNSSH